MTMTLAQPLPSDAPGLLTRIEETFHSYIRGLGREPEPWATRERVFEEGLVWRLQAGDTLVGATILRPDLPVLHLSILAIFAEHQGRGFAAKSLAAIEAHAEATGARQIMLITANIYPHLVALYSRAGYCVQKIGPQPEGKDEVPRLTMTKELKDLTHA